MGGKRLLTSAKRDQLHICLLCLSSVLRRQFLQLMSIFLYYNTEPRLFC